MPLPFIPPILPPNGGGTAIPPNGGGLPRTFDVLVKEVLSVVQLLIPLIFGIGILCFVWGVAKFIYQSTNAVEKEKGRNLMVWGLIAIFVMSSVYGIIFFLYGEFNFTQTFSFPPQLPE